MADKPIALEDRASDAQRLFSPSAARNRDPILQALHAILPPQGVMLEIASGTGEHVVHFARALPGWRFQPTEFDETSRHSVRAWVAHEGLTNVAAPVMLDARAVIWDVEDAGPFDAVLSLNMIHIAPWAAAQGLFQGARRVLKPGGLLLVYGPFQEDGVHNAPSNAAFDASLRARDPDWGVRDIRDLQRLADENGMTLRERQAMPANNHFLTFVKA
jgi:cyclopropane fatty-acyl-phospholipid synthase-like methyltransferase